MKRKIYKIIISFSKYRGNLITFQKLFDHFGRWRIIKEKNLAIGCCLGFIKRKEILTKLNR